MKAHLVKLSLALLSAAFLLGCQEQASSPVEPEGLGPQFGAKKCVRNNNLPGCSGGDEEGGQGSVPAVLVMMGGMTTTSEQPVGFQDGENTLVFNNPMGGVTFAMTLAATHSDFGDPDDLDGDGLLFDETICVPFLGKRADPTNDDLNNLFDKLIDERGNDGQGNRQFFVHIDKNALGDAADNEHTITIVWEDNNEKFNVSVGKLSPTEPGTSTVTLVGDLSSGVVTVTFTGGFIRLRNRTGRVQQYFNLTCPIADGDVITMVLSLPEAG